MSLDATSSGIQIMAALSGCKKTAQLTNMIDPTKRYDIYAEIMNAMNAKLSKPVPRSIVKQVVMTH
jgi:DNA-directed RNA polymerase